MSIHPGVKWLLKKLLVVLTSMGVTLAAGFALWQGGCLAWRFWPQ